MSASQEYGIITGIPNPWLGGKNLPESNGDQNSNDFPSTVGKFIANTKTQSKKTEYWVSQGRKFCEFCKCSISDNKPSIQFHENGKKHKENVAKRLAEMQKKAAKEAKERLNMDKEIKKMEAAALRAYMKDVHADADYTSQLIKKGESEIELMPIEEEPVKKEPVKKPQLPPPPPKKWKEAKSEEGKVYYWNTETGESVWEVPESGFISLEEQERKKDKPHGQKSGHHPKHKNKKGFKKHGGGGGGRKKDDSQSKDAKKEEFDPIMFSPAMLGHPYGKWQKIETKEQKPVDLQLPKQEFVEVTSVPTLSYEPERSFEEKKLAAPGCIASQMGETSFKKRKFNSNPKRNMRQRLDDE